jgi:hypothetical protein
MSNDNGMQTKAWGPPTWAFLFFCAKGYPIKIDCNNDDHQKRKKAMKHQLKSLGQTLPCSLCRKSYRKFICEKDTCIKKCLGGRDDVMKFIYNIHNKVNDKLCVPNCKRPTLEDVNKFYEQFRAGCCSAETFGCRTPGEKNPSVYAKVSYNPRKKNTQDYLKYIPLHATKDNINIECINHILYDDDPERALEYYNQLDKNYKQLLQALLQEYKLQVEVGPKTLHITHIN